MARTTRARKKATEATVSVETGVGKTSSASKRKASVTKSKTKGDESSKIVTNENVEDTKHNDRQQCSGTTEPQVVKEQEIKLSLGSGLLTQTQRKNLKKKLRKLAKKVERVKFQSASTDASNLEVKSPKNPANKVVEYVNAPLEAILGKSTGELLHNGGDNKDCYEDLTKVMHHFLGTNAESSQPDVAIVTGMEADTVANGTEMGSDSEEEEKRNVVSNRKKKEMNRLKIGKLKESCEFPELVEVWDATAKDPLLLVYLKAYRNTVPVPRHWSQKRKYLQGKRGIEKPPFALPAFIEATGIGEMRQAYLEKAEAQKLKAKGRERTQPKMGKLDIDYRILYDAFFRHQTKPSLSAPGDLYYEGKEFEAKTQNACPGVLSLELQNALGMDADSPPPWLVAMQRYGPPPSYPSLKIPGLTAPIPPGAQFGYHPGGWGKPPVDEYGNPIYGDVFGEHSIFDEEDYLVTNVHWGDLDEVSEEEEESEEEVESEEDDVESDAEELAVEDAKEPNDLVGVAQTPSIEAPSDMQIRKGIETPTSNEPKALYKVLEEKTVKATSGSIMGTDHAYIVPDKKISNAAAKKLEALRKGLPDLVDISIDPSDLESLDEDSLRQLYEQKAAEQRLAAGQEDFSGLVAAKAAAQKRKAAEKASNKEKKFKF